MKISKGNVKNINKKILAGTITFAFLVTKLTGYKIIKKIKYSHIKLEYTQTESIDIIGQKEYAIIPKKNELRFNDDFVVLKNNNKKKLLRKINVNIKKQKLK